jgi:hypothetical protein
MGMHLHVRALFTTILGLVFSRLLTEPTHLSHPFVLRKECKAFKICPPK